MKKEWRKVKIMERKKIKAEEIERKIYTFPTRLIWTQINKEIIYLKYWNDKMNNFYKPNIFSIILIYDQNSNIFLDARSHFFCVY